MTTKVDKLRSKQGRTLPLPEGATPPARAAGATRAATTPRMATAKPAASSSAASPGTPGTPSPGKPPANGNATSSPGKPINGHDHPGVAGAGIVVASNGGTSGNGQAGNDTGNRGHRGRGNKPPRHPFARDQWHADKGRLPDGAEFYVAYDATAERWTGQLAIPGGPTFDGDAPGVFTLLTRLDDRYRKWLAAQT
jgi:hypothetical protein